MIRAVLQNGVFVPHDPLPEDWPDGTVVEVDRRVGAADDFDELDRWLAEMEARAAQDDRRLDEAIREHRQQEKALARKRMGLPE